MSENNDTPVRPHGLYSVWSPDEVAECLDGVSAVEGLSNALWTLVHYYADAPRSEWNDDFTSRALSNWWDKLNVEHQRALNQLATAYEERIAAIMRSNSGGTPRGSKGKGKGS